MRSNMCFWKMEDGSRLFHGYLSFNAQMILLYYIEKLLYIRRFMLDFKFKIIEFTCKFLWFNDTS